MIRSIFSLLFFFVCVSCTQENDYWGKFHKRGSKKQILSQFNCDSIIIEDIHSSGYGNFVCDRSEILYLDKVFKFVFKFDTKGNKIGRYNGLGKGPNEFLESNSLLSNKESKVVLGSLSTYYLLDDSLNITKKGVIEWGGTATQKEIYNSPKPKMPEIYEIIEYKNFPCLFNDSLLLIPVNTEHFNYNGYKNLDYYKDSHIFALLDLESGHIKGVKGRRSPEYLKYKYLPNFDFFHFDCDDNYIYITYDVDSSIYVLDKEFQPLFKFGYAGYDMNCDYKPTNGYEDAEERFFTDRETYGYYNYLKFIKETGFLFRTYSKGGKDKDGLQIYDSEYNLVGDIDVTKGFRVIGYHNGTYFAECSEGLNATPMYVLSFTF